MSLFSLLFLIPLDSVPLGLPRNFIFVTRCHKYKILRIPLVCLEDYLIYIFLKIKIFYLNFIN